MKFPLKYLTGFLIISLCAIGWMYRSELQKVAELAAETAALQADKANLIKGIEATGKANQERSRALDILAWRLAQQTKAISDESQKLSGSCIDEPLVGSRNFIGLLAQYATNANLSRSGVDIGKGNPGNPAPRNGLELPGNHPPPR